MNFQRTHNAKTNQKSVAMYFKDVKTEETFSSRDQKVVETTNLLRKFFRTAKTFQRSFAKATTTTPLELNNWKKLNISK